MRKRLSVLVVGGLALGSSGVRAVPRAQEASHLIEVNTPDKGYLHFPVRILDRSTLEALTFDPTRDRPATISYRLTRDGLIQIRAVWRGDTQLVLRTLLDWTPQEYGVHEVTWDGRDTAGNLVDNRGALITFEGDDPVHREHDRAACHEPGLQIRLPAGAAGLGELFRVEARISLHTAFGRAHGYTVRCYLDYEWVGEARLGGDTESFFVPCDSELASGARLLILNLDDGAGHVGVAGLRLRSVAGAAEVAAGRRVFEERGCDLCHDLESTAWREEGPGLAHIASRRPPDYLREMIQSPRAVNRTATMPEDPLDEEALALVMAFLGSLDRPPGPPRSGTDVYHQEGCADCHDVAGESGAMAGPHLVGIGSLRSRAYLEGVVLRPHEFFPRTAMPPTELSPAELTALVDYLRDELVHAPAVRDSAGR